MTYSTSGLEIPNYCRFGNDTCISVCLRNLGRLSCHVEGVSEWKSDSMSDGDWFVLCCLTHSGCCEASSARNLAFIIAHYCCFVFAFAFFGRVSLNYTLFFVAPTDSRHLINQLYEALLDMKVDDVLLWKIVQGCL